jgi:hypothetical protein
MNRFPFILKSGHMEQQEQGAGQWDKPASFPPMDRVAANAKHGGKSSLGEGLAFTNLSDRATQRLSAFAIYRHVAYRIIYTNVAMKSRGGRLP